MTTGLSAIISEDIRLNLIDPGIYSVYPIGETPGAYDAIGISAIYDAVACNRFYNRLMWGYATKAYAGFCEDSFASSPEGWILDLACGSLAFTDKAYATLSNRPVVFLDQSLKLLRKGKSRIEKQKGGLSENMFFLHADARRLPFKSDAFQTVICLNLLHCLNMGEVRSALKEIKRVLAHNGNSSFTTLVQSGRWSTRYLNMLAGSGALISRNIDDILAACHETDMKTAYKITGNLAFITLHPLES
jgi:ubiquinone/menaquinone biosynthesis C-methylase UbiE